MSRILVCGGRDYNDPDYLHKVLSDYLHEDLIIIQGGARGADALARSWCIRNNIPYINFPANWGKFGKGAGPIRNAQMLEEGLPNLVIAFPGGNGTADMISKSRKAGIEVIEVSK